MVRTAASSSSPWHFLCPLGALSWEDIPCQDSCPPVVTQRPRSGCILGYGSHSASPALREMALPGSHLPSLPVTEPACHSVLASALGHTLGTRWEQDRPISAGLRGLGLVVSSSASVSSSGGESSGTILKGGCEGPCDTGATPHDQGARPLGARWLREKV